MCLTEQDKLELFSSCKGSAQVKTIDDPVLGSDMHLAKWGGSVLFAKGDKVYQMSRC